MTPELQRQLIDNYPTLFGANDTKTVRPSIAHRFECGDAWFVLVDALCAALARLEVVVGDIGALPFTALEITERDGSLAIYLGTASEAAFALAGFAEALSAKIRDAAGSNRVTLLRSAPALRDAPTDSAD